jgi:hypothetical protein
MSADDVTAVADRFWGKVDRNGPVSPIVGTACWLWTASIQAKGYGQIHVRRDDAGRQIIRRAHTVAWVLVRGEFAADLEIDHLCRVRHCVNPDHLEAVTTKVNSLRGVGLAALHAQRTACPKGHPYDEANTIWHKKTGGRVSRDCRICTNARRRVDVDVRLAVNRAHG